MHSIETPLQNGDNNSEEVSKSARFGLEVSHVDYVEGFEPHPQARRQGEGEEGVMKRSALRAHGVAIPDALQNQRRRRDNNNGSEGTTDKENAIMSDKNTAENTAEKKAEEKAPDPSILQVNLPPAVQENLGVTPAMVKAVGDQVAEAARFTAYSVVTGAKQGARAGWKGKSLEYVDIGFKAGSAAVGVGSVYGLVLLGKLAIGAIFGSEDIDS